MLYEYVTSLIPTLKYSECSKSGSGDSYDQSQDTYSAHHRGGGGGQTKINKWIKIQHFRTKYPYINIYQYLDI